VRFALPTPFIFDSKRLTRRLAHRLPDLGQVAAFAAASRRAQTPPQWCRASTLHFAISKQTVFFFFSLSVCRRAAAFVHPNTDRSYEAHLSLALPIQKFPLPLPLCTGMAQWMTSKGG
jgi:hypothetical protein